MRLRFRTILALITAGLACRSAGATLAEAEDLYRARRFPEARTAFEAVASAEPSNASAAYHLGMLALMRSDPDAAVSWMEKAVAADSNSSKCARGLGDAYGLSAQKAGLFSKFGFAKKCLAAYQKAVALDPASVDAHFSLYNYYRLAPSIAGGGIDKARAEAIEIQRRDPVRGGLALADLHIAGRKYDDAFRILKELSDKDPQNPMLLFQIGRFAAMTGQHIEEGESSLRSVLAHPPEGGSVAVWAVHWRLGQILEKRGQHDGARAEYEAGLKLNPTQPQLLEALKQVQ